MTDFPVNGDGRPELFVIEGAGESVGLVSQDDYTPATVEESLRWAREMLAKLHGDHLLIFTEVDAGLCEECALDVHVRWLYPTPGGRVCVCRKCLRRRQRTADRLALDEVAA